MRMSLNAVGRRGFTLVELLVVIAIIGILVALLLPAVQAAREAGRRTQCINNLNNLGKAGQQHLSVHQVFPSGGWGWRWAGDPDRGFGQRQPGGWHFNVLPYMEENALHDMGGSKKDMDPVKMAQGKIRCETAVQAFICPTRNAVSPTATYIHGSPFHNIDKPTVTARSDYAANSGEVAFLTDFQGPDDYNVGDAVTNDGSNTEMNLTGIVFMRSQIGAAHIRDGTSHTYFCGERSMDPDHYDDRKSDSNDQGWDLGHDIDVCRQTAFVSFHIDAQNVDMKGPHVDTAGVQDHYQFGSAHAGGFNMAFCDGSVRTMLYEIDEQVHKTLGNRRDGKAVNLDEL